MNQPDHIPHLPKPPRAWLTLLMGGLLLFSGMVVGAGGSLLFFQNRMDQPDNAPKHFSKRLAQRMSHDLNLSEEQSKQVETIFKAHQEEMSTIRLQIKDEVDASFETLKTEVEAVLTPDAFTNTGIETEAGMAAPVTQEAVKEAINGPVMVNITTAMVHHPRALMVKKDTVLRALHATDKRVTNALLVMGDQANIRHHLHGMGKRAITNPHPPINN
jgi:hypothetical protein